MEISRVKKEALTLPDFIKSSVFVWYKAAFPSVLSGFFAFGVLWALTVIFFVSLKALTFGQFVFLAFILASLGLAVVVIFLASLLKISEDIINSKKPSVLNALEFALYFFPRFFASAFFLLFISFLINAPIYLLRSHLYLTVYNIFALFVAVAIFVYIVFFPLAILLRGKGIFSSFKYSYTLVRAKWFYTAGRMGAAILIVSVLNIVLAALFTAVAYFYISGWIGEFLTGYGIIGPLIFSSFSAEFVFPVALCFIFVMLCSFTFASLMSSFLTVLFLNTEMLSTPAVQARSVKPYAKASVPAVIDSADYHEFTEIFKTAAEVDVTERFTDDNSSAMGPVRRDEALREFEDKKESQGPSLEEIDDILETNTSSSNSKEFLDILAELSSDSKPKD